MLHIRWFGIIGVSAIAVAFVAELTLSPALLTLVARARRRSGTPLGQAFGDTIEPVRRAVNE